MNKCFVLATNQFKVWEMLVQSACSLAEYIELNPLYKDQNYTQFLKKLPSYKIIPADKKDGKFYSGRERIRIPGANIGEDLKAKLGDYAFWQNHYLEDPSFWKEDKEILAAISHENMVMVEMDYFGKDLKGLNLELYNI